MLAKTCFESFRKFPENVLSSVPFKEFDLSNPPTYNRTEASVSVPRIFEIVGCASVMETLFNKVTG